MQRKASYSKRQTLLIWWRSGNACVYQRGVRTLDEAKQIIADSGITQELSEVEHIKMPNWS
jgi:hypothetical protein